MVRDVRMRGFADRADLEEVERFLEEHVRSLPSEQVPLLEDSVAVVGFPTGGDNISITKACRCWDSQRGKELGRGR